MLVAAGSTTGLVTPVNLLISTLAEAPPEPGETLGAWTLVRKIGEGGMGAVWAARRSDGHFEQDAAIKLLRGLPSAV